MTDVARARLAPADPNALDPTLAARVQRAGEQTAGARRVFGLLAHQPKLLDTWLRFSGSLLLKGALSRRQGELLVLRTAANCDSAYEWTQHVLIAQELGVSDAEIVALGQQPLDPAPFSDLECRLLAAADELHRDGVVSVETWNCLRLELSPAQLVELCMLVGHYAMLAMTIASAGILPEGVPDDGP
jgi:alkylhydroperoxidase family enzyme